ncbi:MAG TPA: hypothetical protein VH391_00415 [Solirubrobacterales bacterium]
MDFDLDRYRERAEGFCEKLSREYYLHLSGQKPELEIEPIYGDYSDLFDRESVGHLRELAEDAVDSGERRRLRYLLHFAFDGLVGAETKREAEGLALLEASLEVDPGDGPVPYRAVQIEQANEPDAERRGLLEEARNQVLSESLNPLYRASLERSHELCRAFGWSSYAAAYAELRGVDLEALARQTARFLERTEGRYPELMNPRLEKLGLPALGELRRCDLPRFFRAADLDALYPADRLVASFRSTLSGIGVDLDRQGNVHLDTEARRTKSPRAFCSTPRVPSEVYLVIAPHGGRDDYAALFHEGGHAEHYAHTDPDLAFEFRMLGDNSVTESFAFLMEHLVEDREWMRERLGVADVDAAVAQADAARLALLRRYSAKLAYELELHGGSTDFDEMPGRYAAVLGDALRVPWPRESWLADVDEGFYAACYLQAWALEARWRAAVREAHGESWFERAAAGEWVRGLWRQGQQLDARELLDATTGGELDFGELAQAF